MAGTPVLGSSNGGIPELIEEGRTGWICPMDSETRLVSALRRIWDSTEPERYRAACLQTRFGGLTEYVQMLTEIYRGGQFDG